MAQPRIAILVVAYNAEATLAQVLDRVPTAIWEKVEEVIVFDDASQDQTFDVGRDYQRRTAREKLVIFRNPTNLMYGGNQQQGYRYAIARGFDIVVLLHGGGWEGGSRASMHGEMHALARQGWVAATVEYRLTRAGSNVFPAAIADAEAPLPRCNTIWFSDSTGVPRNCAACSLTY